jgi:hypothetical protein
MEFSGTALALAFACESIVKGIILSKLNYIQIGQKFSPVYRLSI